MILEPGIYKRADVDYDAIEAVNQSTLKAIGKSPLHYKHKLESDNTESSEPMRLGSLAHCLLLEPERLELDFAVWAPEGKKDDFKGKAFDEFLELHSNRQIVKQRDVDAAVRIRQAIHASRLAMRYLAKCVTEPILVWRDKVTGILCKARLDGLSLSVPDVLIEIKTARDVSPWAFESAFAKREYDVQAAFYSDGYEAITGRTLYGKCIAVENVEPHDVIVYDLAEVLDTGREIYREMLGKLADCRKSGLWLGQSPTSERTLRLPKWRDPDEQNDLTDLGLEMGDAP
jgi:exodeoxyribonuclease VIII